MDPFTGRPGAMRPFMSHIARTVALAGALSLVPLARAEAQHDGHGGPSARVAEAPSSGPKAATGPNGAAGSHRAGHGPSASDPPAVAAFKAAHADMMRGMAVPYTGDPDVDFRVQMIPHHQGAIDMARVALLHARDPWTRQLAEAVIVEQQREIAEMQAWLARRGVAAPRIGQPTHVMTSTSYRQHEEEPGTRDEARGQSWAPGGGAPAAAR